MKRVLFFSLIFLLTSILFCYELTLVSEGEAIYLASNWLIHINKIQFENKIGSYRIKSIEHISHNGNPLCVVYHLDPKGHILVPSYREFSPIKSFSVISDFDSTSMGYEFVVLEELKIGFDFLQDYKLGESKEVKTALSRNLSTWNKFIQMELDNTDLEEPDLLESKSKTDRRYYILRDNFGVKLEAIEAPPLLETEWGQGWPFWNWCPLLEDERCVVGCGNTAIAQIMKYYKWPKKGEGNHSYYWDNGNKWLGADFSDSYDWNYMPNSYLEYDTQREKDAVAELCYEVCVSTNTGFHPEGSTTTFSDIISALKRYFKYSNNVRMVLRGQYGSLDEWFEVLKSQRDLSRPLEFAMYPKDFDPEKGIYGHAAVIDGYLITDGLKQVHINMGWYGNLYGNYDAYYTLDSILDYTKVEWQGAIIDIIPERLQYTLTLASGTGGTTDPAPGDHVYDEGTEITITAKPDAHYRFNGWTGDVPSGKENDNPIAITMNSDKSIAANFRLIYPPSNFTGQKILNRSLLLAEYINVLKWESNLNNQDINIVKYRIYQIDDGVQNILIELSSDNFVYWHRKVEKDKQYTYAIVAVNDEDREGKPAYVTIQ